MKYDPLQPYNNLPLLPPKADLETKQILRKTISTGRALAELKGLGDTIPNQAMLVDSLTLQEAKTSSEIENILTTNDKLYKALATNSSNIDPITKEVLRYKEALWKGYRDLKNKKGITKNIFLDVVNEIKDNRIGIRERPVIIVNGSTGKTIYTPPDGVSII